MRKAMWRIIWRETRREMIVAVGLLLVVILLAVARLMVG